MEGIKAKDQTDFSKMTDNEVFWYLQGKKQGRQDQLDDQETERLELLRLAELKKERDIEDLELELEREDYYNSQDETDLLNTDSSLAASYWEGRL